MRPAHPSLYRDPPRRTVVARPGAAADFSYLCGRCDLILHDGTGYLECPACASPVDWVDLRYAVWACPTCDAFVNAETASPPECRTCDRPMRRLRVYEWPGRDYPRTGFLGAVGSATSSPLGVSLVLAATALLPLSLALHPDARSFGVGFFLPLMIVFPIVGGLFLLGVARSLGTLHELGRDQRMRVIHGIEHTVVNLLSRRGYAVPGGLTEPGLFNVWLEHEWRHKGRKRRRARDGGAAAIRTATLAAIRMLRRGDARYCFDRRCGTTWAVTFLIASVCTLVALAVGLLFHLTPNGLMSAAGGMILAIAVASRPIGWLVQRTLTVSTRFDSARVGRIRRSIETDGRIRFVVYLHVEPERST